MLTQRLGSLEAAGVVRKKRATTGRGHEYSLTDAGRDMEPIIMSLAHWGQRWARDMTEDDLDPRHLAWSIHLRMNVDAMPKRRTVVEFDFTGAPPDCRRFWIITNAGEVDMCIEHPGFEADLRVASDLRRFVEAWRGFRSLAAEIARGRIRLDGPPNFKRAFPKWLLLSAVAHVDRERPGRERAARIRSAGRASTRSSAPAKP